MVDEEWQPTDPVLLACRELWRAMEDFDETVCRALGIGRSDLRALNALEQGSRSAADLAHQLGLTRGSVTALIDRLEAVGLVSRLPAPDDRRKVLVGLTESTYATLADIYRPLGQRVAAAAAARSERDQRTLARGLADIVEAFRQAGPNHPAAGR
ncbi:MarR family transcriptional regulator [Mycolicibacterium sp. BiH015]|uniref:MarR family winged helix-turn-helix transcriptional regulator n=1 Tax=Mycolicibacterium sp. BiH015 TaxID=3018808 RepID=UPI0022E0B64F|nr:MarR family transcriptional regulator [Mycolicibacterium sp. BiH015]MDA2891844.1 MarR family transcriptional regulator [Mycolicibacterium sp. BiH015]